MSALLPEIEETKNQTIENKNEEVDNDIQECMTNLKILGRIEPKDKLEISDNTFYINKKERTQGLKRWWSNGNRKETIKSLEEFITKLFKTIDTIYNTELSKSNSGMSNNYYTNLNSKPDVFKQQNSNLLIAFTNEINKSITGITNLKQTYKKDIGIVSSLEIIIEKLSVREKKITEILTVNNYSTINLDNN